MRVRWFSVQRLANKHKKSIRLNLLSNYIFISWALYSNFIRYTKDSGMSIPIYTVTRRCGYVRF